ncbi:MAG: MoxR family ATPase [Lachnospira sp.]|nr:MoxR family ATPase [Lachnospira sp.]
MSEFGFYQKKAKAVLKEVKKSVIGKDETICKVMMALLARGHVLIEDIPGVGKTTMALAFAKALGLECNRMQFTPDVMPSDILGFTMYNKATNKFEYKQGAAMCNIFLADEINRTSPKTQSALLQVMEEGMITVDGKSTKLPDPFMVLATQNPLGSAGTQKLPESQLDRFMIKISMGYPSVADEISILRNKQESDVKIKSETVITEEEFKGLRETVDKVFVDDSVLEYVANIAKATRNSSDILQGISPRGSVAIVAMSKAMAFLRGHEYVLPSDVQYVITDTVSHRIVLNKGLRRSNLTEKEIIATIMNSVPAPTISVVDESEKIIW